MADGHIRFCWACSDDHSRLCCHLQWYLAEGARELCHGLCQAFQKRDLPGSLLYDNGSAMIAAETEQGLTRLGVLFENTLPFSPYQNGKQESFWGQIEGRLLPMLEGVADLTLDQLNEVSQPGSRWNTTARSTPRWARLRCSAFSTTRTWPGPVRTPKNSSGLHHRGSTSQRRSDGTLTLEGIRFEIPSRYGHLENSGCATPPGT